MKSNNDTINPLLTISETKRELYGPHWISVKERLPEDRQKVLFYYNSGMIDCGYILENQPIILFEIAWEGYLVNNATHWQPLPEPPK